MVFQRPNPLLFQFTRTWFLVCTHTPRFSLRKPFLDEAVEKALTEADLWKDLKTALKQRQPVSARTEAETLHRKDSSSAGDNFMDEPCSALDTEGTKAVEELMLLLRGNYSIIIVTHSMAQARRISDECIFMLLGEVVEHNRTGRAVYQSRKPQNC